MKYRRFLIMPLATALAGLGVAPAAATITSPNEGPGVEQKKQTEPATPPNVVFPVGEELLGLVVGKQADGTVVAAHSSHVSHASHQSHHSHFSSR